MGLFKNTYLKLVLFTDTPTTTGFKNTCLGVIMMFVMCLPAIIKAQAITVITGGVYHDNHEAVPSARVYLLNTDLTTTTNTKGEFKFENLPAGKYSIQVSAAGYATLIKEIDLNNGGRIDLKLTETARQLDEVIVTAQKSDEQPQKLPLSLSTFSAKQVQDARLWNIKDITAMVPNLTSANPGDNRNVTSIRGVTTTSYDPAVATYIDGVNQFGLDTYIAQLEDVERIEVLRGPQGTLYGRNAMGGVINIITKQPGNETRGFAELNFGNYNQQRYSLGLRSALIKDKLFLGVSGLFTRQDGFYTNQFNNTKFDNQHSFMGNYYLKYLASEKLSFTLNVKHVENRNDGAFPLASDPVTALSQPFMVNQNNTTTLVDNTLNTSLSIRYTGRSFNFSSQSAYQSNYRYYTSPIDGDFSPIDGVSIVNNYGSAFNKVKVGTQEFRFTSPANTNSRFNWVGGFYGFYNSSPVKQGVHYGNDAALLGAPFPNFTSINTNKQSLYGLAIFGQGTYKLSTKLDIIAGLRYDYQHNKETIKGEFQLDGQDAMLTQADTSSTASFKAFSPKVSLAYHISDENNLFGGYSRGFRTGGISQLGADPMSQPPLYAYKPETSNNFELGSKNTFLDNRLRVNATLFFTRINNAQVPTLILPDAITITRNAGKLESKGAELELAIKPLKGLEAEYNFGYTNARYKSLYLASNGSEVNLTGNHQVFTPDVTSMLALQYNYAIGTSNLYKLIVRGEWRYLGDEYFDLGNQVKQNAYHLFNSRIGISAKKVSVFFWTANLFNKHYIDYAYDFGAAHLGNPRTLGVSLRTDF